MSLTEKEIQKFMNRPGCFYCALRKVTTHEDDCKKRVKILRGYSKGNNDRYLKNTIEMDLKCEKCPKFKDLFPRPKSSLPGTKAEIIEDNVELLRNYNFKDAMAKFNISEPHLRNCAKRFNIVFKDYGNEKPCN